MRVERAKSFMYTCWGILAIVIAFQLVSSTAISQSQTAVATGVGYQPSGEWRVICDNGDLYGTHYGDPTWQYITNVFTEAGVVPGEEASMGDVKNMYR